MALPAAAIRFFATRRGAAAYGLAAAERFDAGDRRRRRFRAVVRQTQKAPPVAPRRMEHRHLRRAVRGRGGLAQSGQEAVRVAHAGCRGQGDVAVQFQPSVIINSAVAPRPLPLELMCRGAAAAWIRQPAYNAQAVVGVVEDDGSNTMRELVKKVKSLLYQ